VKLDSPNVRFSLVGPGLHRASKSGFDGAAIWGVHLVPGTYRYTAQSAGAESPSVRSFSVY